MTTIPTVLHDETLLTTQQLAALTNIARQTFEGWRCRKDGGPKVIYLGKQIVRYRWADVKAWREAGADIEAAKAGDISAVERVLDRLATA